MKKLISLFSGCGGMDLGFEGNFKIFKKSYNSIVNNDWDAINYDELTLLPKTGFEIVFANDILESARNAWVPYFSQRCKNVFKHGSIVDLVKNGKTHKFKSRNIDVITGGFPCQDFSIAGKRKGFNSHKSHLNEKIDGQFNLPSEETRGMLYYWMQQVIDIVQPKVFVAENVKGIKSMPGVVDTIKRDFENTGDSGYFVIEPRVINAANYGVPQNRERIFFFGFNKKYIRKRVLKILESGYFPPEYDPFPKITHSFNGNMNLFEEKNYLLDFVTTDDVLLGLNEPQAEEIDLAQVSYSKAKYYGRVQGNIEVNSNKVSPTIRAEHHGNIEFRRLSEEHGGRKAEELKMGFPERRLTVRECARIQTFPDDYEFVRPDKKNDYKLSASASYKLIGNAVPPLLGFHIAKRLETIWKNIF